MTGDLLRRRLHVGFTILGTGGLVLVEGNQRQRLFEEWRR